MPPPRQIRAESKGNLFLSVLLGAFVGGFFIFIHRHRRGEGFTNAAVEAIKHWGPDEPESPPPIDLCEIVKHEDEIREALHSHKDFNDFVEDPTETHDQVGPAEEPIEAELHDEPTETQRASIIPVITKAVLGEFENHPAVKEAEKKVTCRHRWTKYLMQQEPKPTEHLKELLKRYGRLHDKYLREQSLDAALKLPLTSRSNKIRYIVWTPSSNGDLAGQMLSLVSTFLFALLTDRVMLVDFPPEIEHVFCEPFPNSSWLLPPEIKERLMEGIPKAIMAVKQRQPMRKAILSIERGNLQDDKHLLCCHGTLKNVFGHIQWLVIQSDYTFIETIQSNKQHVHQLSELFKWRNHYNDDTFFAVLNRQLLHPSNFLWEKITSQYHIYFHDNDPKPLRIVVHPTSALEPGKYGEALRKVIASTHEITPDFTVSVYSIPEGLGTAWMETDEFKQEFGSYFRTVNIGSSSSIGPGLSPFVGRWRKFITDVWMAGFANDYVVPEHLPVSAVVGLLYRNNLEGVWLLADQLDSKRFKNPEALPEWDIVADRVDCSLIKRK